MFCPYALLQLNTNPSRPVLAVAIELVDYEAYKGFPYVSNRDMTDMNRFYVKRQINVNSNSSIRREFPCFPLFFYRRSGFDFELIKRSTSVNVLKTTKIAVKQETPFLKRVHSSDSSRNTETPHFLLNGKRITLPGDVSIRVYDPIVQIFWRRIVENRQ